MSRHFRSFSQTSSNSFTGSEQQSNTPMFKSPATMDVSSFSPNLPQPNEQQRSSKPALQSVIGDATKLPSGRPASSSGPLPSVETTFPKDTPPEMIPILTLLTSHQARTYTDGYFMVLSDLNTDGKPVNDRRWVEVYGKLTGTVLSIWDADALNEAAGGKEPTPTYINITDSTFRSIDTLPSPSGDLQNIVVLSTTMKNRFLLQFATKELLQVWTASLRLSVFEYTSLQEAYTGALLSSKGSKLNGIRMLLSETKYKHEEWVSVRFGSGMPWRKCWTVVTPDDAKKKKKVSKGTYFGTIAFYEDQKIKRGPLAVVSGAYSAYAVYPMRSVLVNNSTLIKLEGRVQFFDGSEAGEKDASVFLMPETHAGVLGFETLIRFLIPCLDVFQLYGRPSRLNADKSDMRSLLFGMPTLPRNHYLEVSDLIMVVSLQGSDKWTAQEWTKNIKDLLARKIQAGYKGCGGIMEDEKRESGNNGAATEAAKAVSFGQNNSSGNPGNDNNNTPNFSRGSPTSPQGNGPPPPQKVAPVAHRPAPPPPGGQNMQRPPPVQVSRPAYDDNSAASTPTFAQYPQSQQGQFAQYEHERSASEGTTPNNLMSKVDRDTEPISPNEQQQHEREGAGSRQNIRNEIFGNSEPEDFGEQRYGGVSPPPQGNGDSHTSSQKVHRRPVSGDTLNFDDTPARQQKQQPAPGQSYGQHQQPVSPYSQPPRSQSPAYRGGAPPPPPQDQHLHPGQPPQRQPSPYSTPPQSRSQSPYGPPPPSQGQPPRAKSPYGQPPRAQSPYGPPPAGQLPPRAQSPYGPPPAQSPYGQPPRAQSPYGVPPPSQRGPPPGGPRPPPQQGQGYAQQPPPPPQGQGQRRGPPRQGPPPGQPPQGYRGALPPPQSRPQGQRPPPGQGQGQQPPYKSVIM